MKFKNVTVSYPNIYFKTDITHFSSRHSTVIEWCVLELLKKVGEMPKYAEASLDELLYRIFKIDNSDILVKPCIMELQENLQAISRENTVYDETSLKEVPAGNLRLTPQGLEMHKKGLLPGSDAVKTEEILFNLKNRNIIFFKQRGNLTEEPKGIPIIDDETDLDSIPLPESEIKEFLQTLLVRKQYLSPTSVIKDISISDDAKSYAVMWNNKNIAVGLTKNMVLAADSLDSLFEKQIVADALFSKADLRNFINTDFINIPVQNVDDEYKSIIDSDELENSINRSIDTNPAFFINKKNLDGTPFFTETIFNSVKNKPKVIVLCGGKSEKFSVESGTETSDKHLLITLPEKKSSIASEILFCGTQTTLVLGKFTIRLSEDAQAETITPVLCAEPLKQKVDLKSVSAEVFSTFSSKNEDLVYMLPAFGNDDLFLTAIDERVSRIPTISERASFIESVNEKSKRFLDRVMLQNDFIEKKLLSEIEFSSLDFTEAENKLSEAVSVPILQNNTELGEKYAQKVLSVCTVSKADDLWRLLDKAQTIGKKNWVKDTPVVTKLFTLEIMKDIASKCFNRDFNKIPEYTPFEPALKSYIEQLEKLSSQMKQCSISLFDAESKESVTQKLLTTSSEHLKKIKELLKLYRNLEKPLNEYLSQKTGLEETTNGRSAFMTFMDSVENLPKSFKSLEFQLQTIFEAIEFFFDDKTLRYERVYIPDTNALIDHPELLDRFQKINAALVIPHKVIDELDKIKDETAEDTARQARTASRKIQEYQQTKHVPWLTVGEAHPELLSKDLDKEKADNIILSVALKYLHQKPVIITGDRNFSIIAYAEKVKCISADEFLGIKSKKEKQHKGGKK